MSFRYCRACGSPVIFARTEAMKWEPLNPEPDPAANVHAYPNDLGNWLARSVKPGTPAVAPDRLMMPHAATCSGEKPAPRTPELPPDVPSLDKYRRDRAARAVAR